MEDVNKFNDYIVKDGEIIPSQKENIIKSFTIDDVNYSNEVQKKVEEERKKEKFTKIEPFPFVDNRYEIIEELPTRETEPKFVEIDPVTNEEDNDKDETNQEIFERIVNNSCNQKEVKRTPIERIALDKKQFKKRIITTFIAIVVVALPIINGIANLSLGKDNKLYDEGIKIKEEQVIKDLQEVGVISIVNGEYQINVENLNNLNNLSSSPATVRVITNVLSDIGNNDDKKITLQTVVEEMTYEEKDENGNINEYHYATSDDYFSHNNIDNIGDFPKIVKEEIIADMKDNTIGNTTINDYIENDTNSISGRGK